MSVQARLPIHAAALRGQLAAPLLPVRCPSNIRMSVQARLPIHAAALRAYRAKNGLPDLGMPAHANSLFPYVGITQIRLRVKAIQLTLSPLDTQAPRFIFLSRFPFAGNSDSPSDAPPSASRMLRFTRASPGAPDCPDKCRIPSSASWPLLEPQQGSSRRSWIRRRE